MTAIVPLTRLAMTKTICWTKLFLHWKKSTASLKPLQPNGSTTTSVKTMISNFAARNNKSLIVSTRLSEQLLLCREDMVTTWFISSSKASNQTPTSSMFWSTARKRNLNQEENNLKRPSTQLKSDLSLRMSGTTSKKRCRILERKP